LDKTNPASIITLIVILSVICQYLVQQIKEILPAKVVAKLGDKNTWFGSGLIALVFGILLAFLAQADILDAVGVASLNPTIDYILTGILISGGSSLIHDLFNSISSISSKNNAVAAAQPTEIKSISAGDIKTADTSSFNQVLNEEDSTDEEPKG